MAIEDLLTQLALKHARAQLGWSQQKLANTAGIHRATVDWAEKGKAIRLETAYKILQALNAERHRQLKRALRLDDLDWNIKQ